LADDIRKEAVTIGRSELGCAEPKEGWEVHDELVAHREMAQVADIACDPSCYFQTREVYFAGFGPLKGAMQRYRHIRRRLKGWQQQERCEWNAHQGFANSFHTIVLFGLGK
jgi:hypothetical protein